MHPERQGPRKWWIEALLSYVRERVDATSLLLLSLGGGLLLPLLGHSALLLFSGKRNDLPSLRVPLVLICMIAVGGVLRWCTHRTGQYRARPAPRRTRKF
jgi:hypothetical protein